MPDLNTHIPIYSIGAAMQTEKIVVGSKNPVFAERNSKQGGGAIGSLTGGKISRQDLYEHAMVATLIPFKNTDLFF